MNFFRSSSFRSNSSRSSRSSAPPSTPSSSQQPGPMTNKSFGNFSLKNDIFNNEIHFEDINQKFSDWTIPVINQNDLYKPEDKKYFKTSDYIIRTVEKTIPLKEEPTDMCILSEDSILKHQKKFQFIHIGCVQVAVIPLVKAGLDVSTLVCVRDGRHEIFSRSLFGMVEAGLNEGPIYFNCFPNLTASLHDDPVIECLKLSLKLHGFHMKPGVSPVALVYRIQYKVMNSSTSNVKMFPQGKETCLFLTDATRANVNIPKPIKWKDITLPDDWEMTKIAPVIPKPVNNSFNVTQNINGDVRITFDRSRRSFSCASKTPSITESYRTALEQPSRHSYSSSVKDQIISPSVMQGLSESASVVKPVYQNLDQNTEDETQTCQSP